VIPIWVAGLALLAGVGGAWAVQRLARRCDEGEAASAGEPLFFLRFQPRLSVVSADNEKNPPPAKRS